MERELKCEAGCKHYTGGEIKHNKDCVYYPDSLSKIFDDMKQELSKLRQGAVSGTVQVPKINTDCKTCGHSPCMCRTPLGLGTVR